MDCTYKVSSCRKKKLVIGTSVKKDISRHHWEGLLFLFSGDLCVLFLWQDRVFILSHRDLGFLSKRENTENLIG